MHSRSRSGPLLALVVLILAAGPHCFGMPTVLNYCPSVDLIPNRTVMLQASGFLYDFRRFDPVTNPRPPKFDDASMIYSLGFGFRKAEMGVDFVADRSFSNPDSGLWAGPIAWNFKYRFLTQGSDSISLAAGVCNLGATRYSGQDYYSPSPYLVAAKSFDGFRLHLGYQMNLLGYRRIDSDRQKNDGLLAGFDTVIIKDKVRPVSLLVDYFGGPAKTLGLGVYQLVSPQWLWGFSYFHPIQGELSASKAEMADQYQLWVGHFISY